jgi:hypothetical protein
MNIHTSPAFFADHDNKRSGEIPDTGKMTMSAIMMVVVGGSFELWIVFTLIFAGMKRHPGRPYLSRVRDALKFQLR